MPIFSRLFWKTYWIALRRFWRDSRSRLLVLRVTYLLLAFPLYIFGLLFFSGPADEWKSKIVFDLLIIGAGGLCAFVFHKRNQRDDELLRFSIVGQGQGELHREIPIAKEVRTYLEERAYIVAALLARAGSEIFLQHHARAEGSEIVTRQLQNTQLRERGLWDKLEPSEAELFMSPDGCWAPDQYESALSWCEQLRLLRWVLGVDAELEPLAHFPFLDFELSNEILRVASGPRSANPVVKSWDVRVQRDLAQEYAVRVVVELAARGLIPSTPNLEGWGEEFRDRSLGESTDYLAGSKTVGELDEPELRKLGAFAVARRHYAGYLVDLLEAGKPFSLSSLE